jgi:predicted dienelactone hydrolase
MGLSWWRKIALVVLGLSIAGVGAVGVVLWRGIPFPKPTGLHAVGRTSYHLIDSSRPEIFTEDAADVRELMVTVHYPADTAARAPRAPYADATLAAGIAEAFNTPSFVLSLMHSHALDRPPCQTHAGGFPVVIFSPGLGAPPLLYTASIEDLASHGFVVVSVSHPYSIAVTAFPDGRTVRQNEAGLRSEASLQELDDSQAPKTGTAPQDDPGAVWVKDVRFVLDELERMNRDDELLAGRLNLSWVGIFGHSFGGATSARTVQIDDRFRAGINMDGTDFRVTAGTGISRPMLWMVAELHEIDDAALTKAGKTRAWADEAWRTHDKRTAELLQRTPDGSRLLVRGAAHLTFASDLTLVGSTMPWTWLVSGVDLGTIPGRRAVSLMDAYVVAFFQKHLQGQSVPLLEGSTGDFPEVELKRSQP